MKNNKYDELLSYVMNLDVPDAVFDYLNDNLGDFL
jgi:hypothetical protein